MHPKNPLLRQTSVKKEPNSYGDEAITIHIIASITACN